MPWQADVKNDEALKQHELSVISRASELGALIHSQSSAYEFDWDDGGRIDGPRTGRLVVLPGFCKITDERGALLEAPQVLVPAKFQGM